MIPRYRCRACGNLTRFDVTTTRRTRSFHHYSLGGDLAVEEEAVLSEVVEDVACRWCGHGTAVERVSGSTGDSTGDGTGTTAGSPAAAGESGT
ncbi:MAG: hypothetical protein ACRD1K_05165 [Acidimicrobiales bacterium]